MAAIETLEDLRELNAANSAVDTKVLILSEEEKRRKQEEQEIKEDEEEIRRIFGKNKGLSNIELAEEIVGEEEYDDLATKNKKIKVEKEEKLIKKRNRRFKTGHDIGIIQKAFTDTTTNNSF